jgi:hypothetical protein
VRELVEISFFMLGTALLAPHPSLVTADLLKSREVALPTALAVPGLFASVVASRWQVLLPVVP